MSQTPNPLSNRPRRLNPQSFQRSIPLSFKLRRLNPQSLLQLHRPTMRRRQWSQRRLNRREPSQPKRLLRDQASPSGRQLLPRRQQPPHLAQHPPRHPRKNTITGTSAWACLRLVSRPRCEVAKVRYKSGSGAFLQQGHGGSIGAPGRCGFRGGLVTAFTQASTASQPRQSPHEVTVERSPSHSVK